MQQNETYHLKSQFVTDSKILHVLKSQLTTCVIDKGQGGNMSMVTILSATFMGSQETWGGRGHCLELFLILPFFKLQCPLNTEI